MACLLAAAVPSSAPAATAEDTTGAPAFKIFVAEPGVYRVSYAELADLDLDLGVVDIDRLSVTSRGEAVPIWIEDGGDGTFGPGDHFELVGEHLAGETSYYDEFADYNVYRLRLDGDGDAARMRAMQAPAEDVPAQTTKDRLWVQERLEADRLMLRFSQRSKEPPELWYWAKLTHIDPKPFSQKISLRTYDADAETPLSLTVALKGWSHPRRREAKEIRDHRVEVLLNGQMIGWGEWNAQADYRIEVPEVPRDLLKVGANDLQIQVPERILGDPELGEPLIDVVMLNWIELSYPHNGKVRGPQNLLTLGGTEPDQAIELTRKDPVDLVFYGSGGERYGDDGIRRSKRGNQHVHAFLPPEEGDVFVVADGRQKPVAAVQIDRPSDLRSAAQQADYLMITHPLLRNAIEPLAEFHRDRGLNVAVVDVHDIYDEFNHGVLHPRAIRDFVRHTHSSWRAPAPRFVLLVGDASWDTKADANDDRYADWTYWPGETSRFLKNSSTPYSQESELGHRNLIPTWPYQSHQGHAASDNYFVTLSDDKDLPGLAIGRLPITDPAELQAIVTKTRRYVDGPSVGPWRSRILWITNEQRSFQRRTDRIANAAAARGFVGAKVYPKPEEADNLHHQTALREAFDDGQLLVHFYGHGGRYIWRTGPPDFRKNHDLFTLDDLDQLDNTDQLPMVLSMSCYSAPFDHPTADSIGEKFLRMADKGAIAVLAASWRNSPTFAFSTDLVEKLTEPGKAIGEAIMEAKQATPSREMIAMYNLLGDPAIELAVPRLGLEIESREASKGYAITARVTDEGFRGRALVDWLDASWQVIESREVKVDSKAIQAKFKPDDEQGVHAVRVYVWNEDKGIDGVATLELASEGAERVAQGPATPADPAGSR
ncbi:MAG: C25 family cysteine peptidase [Acidobacteriota bacterium]